MTARNTGIGAAMLAAGGAAFVTLAAAGPASAATVYWTYWNSPGTDSASGVAGSVGVTYSGELENLFFNYPSWQPASSYVGGSISNAPPSAGGIIQLFGGPDGLTDTITFSHPVTDPVMAIWSLGAGGTTASFVFTSSEPFTIQAGGPSNEYGGGPIYVTSPGSETVLGAEGNGTIRFSGTYSSITWTNPGYENWYGFTVGVVPEPATWSMVLLGIGGLGGALRSRRKMGIAAA